MAKIYWSELAKQDYWNNIDYLIEEWSTKDASAFIKKVEDYLNVIAKNPKTFTKTNYRNTHTVPIVSQVALFYRVINKNEIELIRFWNNKKDPNNFSLK